MKWIGLLIACLFLIGSASAFSAWSYSNGWGQTNNVYAWWKLVDNGTVWWTNATAIGGYGPVNSSKCVLHVPYQQWKWGGITT